MPVLANGVLGALALAGRARGLLGLRGPLATGMGIDGRRCLKDDPELLICLKELGELGTSSFLLRTHGGTPALTSMGGRHPRSHISHADQYQ